MRVPRRYRKRSVLGYQARHGRPRSWRRLMTWTEREELERAKASGDRSLWLSTTIRLVYSRTISELVPPNDALLARLHAGSGAR